MTSQKYVQTSSPTDVFHLNKEIIDQKHEDLESFLAGDEIRVQKILGGISIEIGNNAEAIEKGNMLQVTIPVPCTGLPRVICKSEVDDKALLITPQKEQDSFSLEVIKFPSYTEEFFADFKAKIARLYEIFSLDIDADGDNRVLIYTDDKDSSEPAVMIQKVEGNRDINDRIEEIDGASYLVMNFKNFVIKIRTARRDYRTDFHTLISEGFVKTNFLNFYELSKLLDYIITNSTQE